MSNLKKKEFNNFNVLVVGDSGTDEFIHGTGRHQPDGNHSN